jgi:hypothetical protein
VPSFLLFVYMYTYFLVPARETDVLFGRFSARGVQKHHYKKTVETSHFKTPLIPKKKWGYRIRTSGWTATSKRPRDTKREAVVQNRKQGGPRSSIAPHCPPHSPRPPPNTQQQHPTPPGTSTSPSASTKGTRHHGPQAQAPRTNRKAKKKEHDEPNKRGAAAESGAEAKQDAYIPIKQARAQWSPSALWPLCASARP